MPTPSDTDRAVRESRVIEAAATLVARGRAPTPLAVARLLGWSHGLAALTLARLEGRPAPPPHPPPACGLGLPGGARPDVEGMVEAIRAGWGEDERERRRRRTTRRLERLAGSVAKGGRG